MFKEEYSNRRILDRETVGDASEAALLKCFELEVGPSISYREAHSKVCEIPFNSTNKYQVYTYTYVVVLYRIRTVHYIVLYIK